MSWTLEEGVDLCRRLRTQLVPLGWDVGLTGSVLHAGISVKDLDVIVFPLDSSHWMAASTPTTPLAVKMSLEQLGMTLKHGARQVRAVWRKTHPDKADEKIVEIWECADGRRVDVFCLR